MKVGKQHGLEGRLLDLFGEFGGRGLYRDKQGYQLLHEHHAEFRRLVIRDALAEDAREAASMGADLLKDTELGDAPDF